MKSCFALSIAIVHFEAALAQQYNQPVIQGGSPMGVTPPTGGVPTPPPMQGAPVQAAPTQIPPGMVFPTVLPPSSGPTFANPNNALNPTQPAPTELPLSSGSSTSSTPQFTQGIQEIITFDKKSEERPILVVKTSEGEFKIKMAADVNRQTVQHFMGLAQGTKEFVDIKTGKKVRRPFYTGLNCHRVLKGVLIQCGCPFGNGRGNPGVLAADERNPGVRFNKPGIVAMALQVNKQGQTLVDSPNTAGSQFFISLAKLPDFDGKYAILGEITSGMDTIRKIASTPTGPTDRPIKRVLIFSIDPDIAALPLVPVNPDGPPTPTLDPMAAPIPPMDPLGPGGTGVDPFALPPTTSP